MPREEMRDRMRAAYAEETRIAQEKVKRAGIDREATAAGRAEGERAASRMGVDTPFEMAMAAPAIGMAQQSGGRRVYNREGIVLPDEAAGLSALNSAGFFIPGMVNQRFGERLEEGRRQEPGFALAGDVAGGMIPGELIGQGIAQVGKMIAPQFARLGSMLKGKPEDAPLVLGPESRIRPIDRPDAFPGDDVLTAKALDQWTPPPEQQVRPMGFFGGKKPPVERTQDTIGREIKDIEKQLRRKGYTLNEAETLAEEGTLPPELRGLMIQHGDLVRESGRMQGAARTAKGGVETDPEYLRAESEMNKAMNDVANAEYEIARELRERGLNWEGDDAEFMGVVDQLRREGKLSNYLASRVDDLRAASTRMFDAEAKMKSRVKSFGLLTERGKDAVEQTFGAAYMSGTGSVAGGQYDLNGDGQIDNTDLAIGSGIGLAAFASPLALRKVAELGGRLKGTRPQGMVPEAPRTPQQAAKFETPGSPEYEAAKAKGLDMSQAGRMARAKDMGFDTETVLYHGTVREGFNDTTDIKAFDKGRTGDRWGADKEGFFFTTDPEEAGFYAKADSNFRRTPDTDARDAAIYPVYGKVQNPLVIKTPRSEDNISFWDANNKRLTDQAKAQGADGIVLQEPSGRKMVVIFDPANIRSVNAAFDPDKAASPILTAGFDASRPRVAKRETREDTFFDDRLTPSENKAVEMRKNGYTAEEIADEMDTSRNTVDQLLFKAKAKGVEIGAAARDRRVDDVLELAKKGLTNKQIEERLGLNPGQAKVFLSQERGRIRKAGEELPDWLKPKVPPRGGGRPPKGN
jgi:DNA-binding CsgD family transcriptional regulator